MNALRIWLAEITEIKDAVSRLKFNLDNVLNICPGKEDENEELMLRKSDYRLWRFKWIQDTEASLEVVFNKWFNTLVKMWLLRNNGDKANQNNPGDLLRRVRSSFSPHLNPPIYNREIIKSINQWLNELTYFMAWLSFSLIRQQAS